MKYIEVIELLKKEDLLVNEENPDDMIFKTISYNSLDVNEDTLFFCKGYNFKEQYLDDAIEKGATCYISEVVYEKASIPLILVKDIRKAIAIIANKFYKTNDNLFKIGITGTKGKTTTVYFLHNILNEWLNKNTAYISTIDYYTGKEYARSLNTTPDSIELLKMFQEINESNLQHVVMEVSSQAVRLDRTYGIDFDLGAFLNISLDHISPHEHPDFKDYLNCKIEFLKNCKKIFLFKETDEYDYIIEQLKDKNIITFGFDNTCDYIIQNIEKLETATSFEVKYKEKIEKYEITIGGKFNCINACCAIAIAKDLNIPYECIYDGLYKTVVSGRMNVYKGVCPIIIDYAHNKLSIENLFNSIKEDYPNCNLKVVMGCPGEKAFNRRKEFADLCGKYASYVYITADDPGLEDATTISNEIANNLKPYNIGYEIIEDREMAIIKAINDSNENDVIAIIGKGHETYQLVGTQYLDYKSDMKIVEEQLQK